MSLVAAIAVARMHWRPDVAPFGRHTSSHLVLARPASFVVGSALGRVRMLTGIGCGLLGLAILCLLYQFVADFSNATTIRGT